MVAGILTSIGLVLHGIGQVAGKAWDTVRDFFSWFLSVIPAPLKFFLFLYFLLFVITGIMPTFLGVTNQCDSQGNAYHVNFLEINRLTDDLDNMAEVCALEGATDRSDLSFIDYLISTFSNPVKELKQTQMYVSNIWKNYYSFRNNGTLTAFEQCQEFSQLLELDDFSAVSLRDFALSEVGEKIEPEGYEQTVHVGCIQIDDGTWSPSLLFYTVDIFDFKLWLLLGLFSLVPLAFKWYSVILSKK